jgi:hypothetical protein
VTNGAVAPQSAPPVEGDGDGAPATAPPPTPTEAPKRRRRRVFRKGTGAAADHREQAEVGSVEPGAALRPSSDELDLGWGERPGGSGVGDRWLEEQRPPHYE